MDPVLNGLHIAILVTDGFEEAELTEPCKALEGEGAIPKIVSHQRYSTVQAMNRGKPAGALKVEVPFDEVDANDFDAAVLPGGADHAARIRDISHAQNFMQDMDKQGKPIAVLSDGAWLLLSAGLVEGRSLTAQPALCKEIQQGGGNWVDSEVVVDRNWVSSRQGEDMPLFIQKMIEVFGQRMQANLRGKADEHAVGIAGS